MERKFYPENFEDFVKGHADNFRMRPSKKVWHGIYNDLYPGRRWPSIAITMVFVFTLVVIGHLNTTNSHTTPLSNPSYANQNSKSSKISIIKPINKLSAPAKISYTGSQNNIISPSVDKVNTQQNRMPLNSSSTEDNIVNNTLVESSNAFVNTSSFSPENKNEENKNEEIINDNISVEQKISEEKNNPSELDLKVINTDAVSTSAPVNLNSKKKNKAEWIYYIAPTISYRNFRDNTERMNNATTQKPMIGLEVGTVMSFKISGQLQALTGLQVNYSGYNIKANTSHPTVATLMLNTNVPGFKEPYSSISTHGNKGGPINATLKNYSIYASFPVGLQYTFGINDNVKLNAVATFQPSFLVKGNAYLLSTDNKNYLTNQSLERKWNMSTNLGTFVSFKSNSFNWQIGPQINYQLLSTYSKRSPYNEHFINYGIRFGISKISK